MRCPYIITALVFAPIAAFAWIDYGIAKLRGQVQ